MPRATRLAILTLLLAAAACSSASKVEVPDDAGPTEIFALAEGARQAGNLKGARELYEQVFEDYPASPESLEAEWLAAEMSFELGDWERAREAFKEFHATHQLDHLGELENRMYEIGDKLYTEGESGLLGVGILTDSEEGIDALVWLTENLPNGIRADDAIYYIAEKRFKERYFEEAVVFLNELLTRYPETEWRYEARFLKALAHRQMNRGAAYDMEALIEARSEFQAYIKEVEADPARKMEYRDRLLDAQEAIKEIEQTLAQKNVLIAKFYISMEQPEAARIYLENAVSRFAETAGAKEAGEMLKELEVPKE